MAFLHHMPCIKCPENQKGPTLSSKWLMCLMNPKMKPGLNLNINQTLHFICVTDLNWSHSTEMGTTMHHTAQLIPNCIPNLRLTGMDTVFYRLLCICVSSLPTSATCVVI